MILNRFQILNSYDKTFIIIIECNTSNHKYKGNLKGDRIIERI